MTLWFSATAAAPAIALELSLRPSGAAWLTMAVQGGFVAGTLLSALLNLADVLNAAEAVCRSAALAGAARERGDSVRGRRAPPSSRCVL